MEDNLKVLIVDDDLVDRMLVRRSLKNAGMNVLFSEAEDCAEALQILAHESFDCIFVDYQLPVGEGCPCGIQDGLTLIQHVRKLKIESPIVTLTGHGDEQVAVNLMKAGATDYLTKSRISPESLSQILRNVVRVYRAEAEIVMQRADFITHLTHDLRTPLVAANMMLKLFKKEAFGALPAEMAEPLNAMIRSNRNLLDMVNVLLEVSCYEAGEKILTPTICNMWQISQEVIQELEPLAQDKGLELKLTVISDTLEPNDRLLVMGDCQEIRRMITNLVGNSLKFTVEGYVELCLQLAPPRAEDSSTITGWVMLSVQDTGIGMCSDQQRTIFQRYRKGSHKQSSSGLGLHLVQRIVTVHQGTIQVSSEVGKGSLFTIYLPLHTDSLPTCSDDD
jgi:two-component system, sensor histidine kinase and response regulator